MAERSLTVKIIGDESDLLRSFRTSTAATQRFSASFGTFVKGALIFEGVRRGIDLIGDAVRAGTAEFAQAQKVTAQTNAVLRSTQGIANVTAADVNKLAGNLQNLSGIDDELIQSGANLILTFKNVRNEIGQGNAIFDRATRAALDLSVAGFGSVESTAKQLGKALNDPVRGMTALRRAGVTFTKEQEDLVKELVNTNRTLDAQKLVLGEVESQVGGSAAALGNTLPGQLNKVREAFRNAFGNLVAVVADPLARALGAVSEFIPAIEAGIARLGEAIGPALSRFVDAFVQRLPEIQRVAGSILDPIRENVFPILQEFSAIVGRVWSNILDVFSDNEKNIRSILDNLGAVLQNVWTVARPTIVFLFEKVLPTAMRVTIPLLEKITDVVRVMSDIWVRAVGVIIQVIDAFLGALSSLTDAASHLPFVGDQFAGISDKINDSRDFLRSFGEDLDGLDGRTVSVNIAVDVTTGRREEGALGRTNTNKEAEDAADKVVKSLDKQGEGANRIDRSARNAEKSAKNAKTAAERQREAFDELLGALGLQADAAAQTRKLEDDIAVLRRTEAAVQKQIEVEGRTNELVGKLQDIRQERTELIRRQRQGRQFEALGLTATGDEKVPGVGALRSRLGRLQEQIKGTVLDTAKTRGQLKQIAKVLSGQFGAVGKDVRQAILDMFNEISGGLDEGTKRGPLTKTSGLNTAKFLEGMGLSPNQIRELRGRLSGLTDQGRAGSFRLAPPTTALAGFGGAQGPVLVESHTTINLDGQRVAKVVTRNQQKAKARNPTQKRGPNRSRNL